MCEVEWLEGRGEVGLMSGLKEEMEAKETNQLSSPAVSTPPN